MSATNRGGEEGPKHEGTPQQMTSTGPVRLSRGDLYAVATAILWPSSRLFPLGGAKSHLDGLYRLHSVRVAVFRPAADRAERHSP